MCAFANGLARRGHQVCIIHPGGTADAEILAELDGRIRRVETAIQGSRSMGLPGRLLLSRQLANAVPVSDVVFATYTPTLPAAWWAVRGLKKGRLAWLSMDFEGTWEGSAMLRAIARWGARRADRILVISSYLKDVVHGLGARTPIDVVGLALIAPELYFPDREAVEKPENVLYVGDDRPRKGLEDFLSAAKIIHAKRPATQFILCLKAQPLREFGVPVQLHVRPSHAALRQLYAGSSVFLSTTWEEGFGLPPLEAMACGAAVVMTDSGGNRDYARPGHNCLVIPPRQPGLAADAVLSLLEDGRMRAVLRKNGLQTARETTWEAVLDRFEASLNQLMGTD